MNRLIALLIALSFGTAIAAIKGIPADVQMFPLWAKLVKTGMPMDGPHAGKNKVVYGNETANKSWGGKGAMRVDSLVVKTAGNTKTPDFVAIMRKTAKGWEYEEYIKKAEGYSLLASGASCSGCHEQAKAKDFLFTR